MARPIKILHAETEIVKELRRRSRAATASVRDRERAEVILLRLQGKGVEAIAEQLNTTPKRVSTWSKRFEMAGLAGLDDKKGRGRKPSIPDAKVASIITEATRPPKGRSRWSTRSMAKHAGVSASTVQRIWSRNDLKPHITKIFKLSNDPDFEAKFWDVVGLYLDPPDKALVLCVDEKSQIQALDRTQPGLPMKKGRAGTMTHDYKRNGTTTLFAALNMLDRKVIGTCMPRHRHREFLRFLKLIDQQIAEGLDLHLIVDNYATHKTPAVKRWLKAHPRFHLHFTPTSASWLNMVERFFAEITRNRIRRGAFKSVAELKGAIMQYLENHNADPKPLSLIHI